MPIFGSGTGIGGLAVVVTGATVVVFGPAVVDVIGATVEVVVDVFSVVVVSGAAVVVEVIGIAVVVFLRLVSGSGVSVNGLIPGFLLVGSGGGGDVWAETVFDIITITLC